MTTEAQIVEQTIQKGIISDDDMALLEDMSEIQADERKAEVEDMVESGQMARLPTGGPGYVRLRRVSDGKVKDFPRTLLAGKLRQRFANGQKAWVNPRLPWVPMVNVELLPCLLHPAHADSAKYRSMGLFPCSKNNFVNQQAVLIHMQNKHAVAWGAIRESRDREREEGKDERYLETMRIMLEKVIGASRGGSPIIVSPDSPDIDAGAVDNSEPAALCECGASMPRNAGGMSSHLRGKQHSRWAAKH